MLVPFRNGLLKYQSVGGNLAFPTFLSEQITGSTFNVTLNATTSSLVGLISNKDNEYVVSINSTVNNAWSGLTNGTMYYLFVDLDKRGQTVYTASTVHPLYGPTDPAVGLQPGQTFFNTASNQWKAWTGGFWEIVNRLYVGRSNGTLTTHNTSGSFSASNYEYVAGNLILDSNQKAIIKSDKTFLTTADNLSVNDISFSSSKFDFLIDFVEAGSNLGAFVVCKRNPNGSVTTATPGSVGFSLLSITLESASIGSFVDVLNNGVVTNLGWTWGDIGNAVYVTEQGTLVDYNPFTAAETVVDASPVGRVVGVNSVYFYPPLSPSGSSSSVGPQGPQGPAGNDGAQGPQGPAGNDGAQGPAGNDGAQGPAGNDGAQGPAGNDGNDGANGWSPIMAIVSDGTRRVMQVFDWTGGTGTKPTTGEYVGPTGLTANIANAVDIRGAAGAGGGGSGGSFAGTWSMRNFTEEFKVANFNINNTPNLTIAENVNNSVITDVESIGGTFQPAEGITANVPLYSELGRNGVKIKWQDFVGGDVYVAFMADYSTYLGNLAFRSAHMTVEELINEIFMFHKTSAGFPNKLRTNGFFVKISNSSNTVSLYTVINGVRNLVGTTNYVKTPGNDLIVTFVTSSYNVYIGDGNTIENMIGDVNVPGLFSGSLMDDCEYMDVSVVFIQNIAGDVDWADYWTSWINLGSGLDPQFALPVSLFEVTYSDPLYGFFNSAQAILPIGANDNDWYLVNTPGFFGGKNAIPGDYVKIIDNLTDIIITRLPLNGGPVESVLNRVHNPEWYSGSHNHYPSVSGLEHSLMMFERSFLNNLMCTCSGRDFARYFDDFVNYTHSASLSSSANIQMAEQTDIVSTNFLGAIKIDVEGSINGPGHYYYTPSLTTAPISTPFFNMYEAGGVLEFTCSVKMTAYPVNTTSKYSYGITTFHTSAEPVVSVEWNGVDSNFILRYGAFTATSTVLASDYYDSVVDFKIVVKYGDGVEVGLFVNSKGSNWTDAVAYLLSMDSSLLTYEVVPYFGLILDSSGSGERMTQIVDYIGLQAFTNNGTTRPHFGFSEMFSGPKYPLIINPQ